MADIETIKFSANNWQHLYSLSQAIKHQLNNSGRSLLVSGQLSSNAQEAIPGAGVQLRFIHNSQAPDYPHNTSGKPVLGLLIMENDSLGADIHIADDIFNELKKNLIEYADIEGIHMIFSLQLEALADGQWQILELDYAMKGDA